MIKNFIIIVQFFIIITLLVQKPQNLDVLIKDAATVKDMVVEGAEYLHETFDREFEVHTDEEFKKEHGDKVSMLDDNTIQEWDIYEK
tara:strand:- start:766 stop:1026 length:261 start_codon:yes stop_codon:yes gene_type:complete